MAQRHQLNFHQIDTVLIRLEELVRANSGNDTFEEVFKIILVKLFLDKKNKPLYINKKTLIDEFNSTLREISIEWPNLLTPNEYQTGLSLEHLQVCLNEIQEVDLLENNLASLDAFFEFLVSKTSKGEKGQFFTPRHIIECCVKIIDPKIEDYILDPACGSGGFLFHSLKYSTFNNKTGKNIWGFDFDPKAIKVAKTLITLAGGNTNNLFNINSLLKPLALYPLLDEKKEMTIEDILRTTTKNFKGFDAILTNPPFAGEIKEQTIIDSYEVSIKGRKNERDVLFIERCVDLLKPQGKLAIILPHNKVGGKNFSYIREWLAKHMQIIAVLSLPRSTFLPHTHQKADIIFALKRKKPIKLPTKEDILFLIAEKNSKDKKGNLIFKSNSNKSSSHWDEVDHDLNDVVKLFKKFTKEQRISW